MKPSAFHMALVLAVAIGGCTVLHETGAPGAPAAPGAGAAGAISDQWTIQWNDVLGTPARMTNRSLQDVVVSRSTPAIEEAAARQAVDGVLRDNAEWFRLRPGVNELTFVSSHTAEWLRIVRLQQRYRGVPVVGGGYEARVFPNGRVGSIEGRFEPDLELSATPSVSEQEAESRAQAVFIGGEVREDIPPVRFDLDRVLPGPRGLAILPSGDRRLLAWAILVQPTPQVRWRVYVDAQTGDVIGRQLVSDTRVR